jgi:hypothetical protein
MRERGASSEGSITAPAVVSTDGVLCAIGSRPHAAIMSEYIPEDGAGGQEESENNPRKRSLGGSALNPSILAVQSVYKGHEP